MIDYIIGFLAILYAFNKAKFILFRRRKWYKPAPLMKGAEPIFKKKGKVGALFIHGFTSSPQEFKETADYLARRNITVSVPLLKGHGTCPEDLNRTDWKDWQESAARAYFNLKKECDKVYLIGDSAGGNIAILLAEKLKLDGIILIGTLIKFRRQKLMRAALPFINAFKNYQKKKHTPEGLEELLKERVHYKVIPLVAFFRFINMMNISRRKLSKVKAPTLIMQARNDFLTLESNAREIYDRISSRDKKLLFFETDFHVLLVGDHKHQVFRECFKFIDDRENGRRKTKRSN